MMEVFTQCGDTDEDSNKSLLRIELYDDPALAVLLYAQKLYLFIFFVGIYKYSEYKMRSDTNFSHNNYVLILPSYFAYIKWYIVSSSIVGVVAVLTLVHPLIYILMDLANLAFFRVFLGSFFLQGGAGKQDIIRAAKLAVVATVLFLCLVAIAGLRSAIGDYQGAFISLSVLRVAYAAGWICPLVISRSVLYRRRAFNAFALVNGIELLITFGIGFAKFFSLPYHGCVYLGFNILFEIFVVPACIVYALNVDSRYWKGLLVDASLNPMDGMWDLDHQTVSCLQENVTLSSPQESNITTIVPVIDFERIALDHSLGVGGGGFSRVYFGTFKKRTVALKLLYVMELTPIVVKQFYLEAQVLVYLKHPCVVDCVGITISPPAFGVVMEYCANGSLFDFLYANKSNKKECVAEPSTPHVRATIELASSRFPSDQVPPSTTTTTTLSDAKRAMLIDAADALAFMHSKAYMHCDMKSLNYLVADDLHLKLSDLGEVRSFQGPHKHAHPPKPAMNWCPPEVLVPDAPPSAYTAASDVFGLAMVLSEIILEEIPLNLELRGTTDYNEWYEAIVVANMRPVIPADCIAISATLRHSINAAWDSVPDNRPTASQLLETLRKELALS